MTEQKPQRMPHGAVMFDFDGTLCDMSPFVDELDGGPDRWARFFAHTPEAAPVEAGLELLGRVHALGWAYTVSTTRDPRFRALVLKWLIDHRPASLAKPVMVLTRKEGRLGYGPAVWHKAKHGRRRYGRDGRPLTTALFVDDELEIVDALVDLEVPAIHLEEIVGLSDTELRELLTYSVRTSRKRWLEAQAAADATADRARRDRSQRVSGAGAEAGIAGGPPAAGGA